MGMACVSQLTAGRDRVNSGTSELHSWALSFTLCLSIYLLLSASLPACLPTCPPAFWELAVDEGGLLSYPAEVGDKDRRQEDRERRGGIREKIKKRKAAIVLKGS